MKRDPVARRLAAAALAVATLALVLAAYGVSLGQQYLEDVQSLGDSLQGREAPVLRAPPLQLETE